MDDILVYSSSYEGYVQHIEWALHALRDAGFKVALEKCQFFLTTISFLGHVVTDQGLQPEPQKVTVVRDVSVPMTITQVRAVLGLASYYRRFIKGFAAIAGPLTNLLRKDQSLIWTPECDQAFSKLKAALISAPVLIRPDPEKPFVLITDWQPEAISAILAQVGPSGLESVVEYASKSAYSGMIGRWATVLQSMDFDIRHRKHERHGNADGLTRLHRPEKVPKSEEVIPWNEPEQEIGPRYGQVEILSKHGHDIDDGIVVDKSSFVRGLGCCIDLCGYSTTMKRYANRTADHIVARELKTVVSKGGATIYTLNPPHQIFDQNGIASVGEMIRRGFELSPGANNGALHPDRHRLMKKEEKKTRGEGSRETKSTGTELRSPRRQVMSLGGDVFNLLDEPSRFAFFQPEEAQAAANTAVDIKETPTAYEYLADLPGLSRKDVKVQVENGNILVITGERNRETKKKRGEGGEEGEEGEAGDIVKYHRLERRMGKFIRSFTLPSNANLGKISARCKDGVLSVIVPKIPPKEPERPKTIDVPISRL
ncbi:hypothetical protein CBR_g7966 [Chara braunii]|uniref:Uncharacterized protein n=1 Tax=Chara braunii TaxID=69332 RepID=A0A388KKU3_CHABU|nr:hypothetical protein CBR_g7966 [Chara braunii]|eukprot:GBG70665.1 hypothetical protein CBR_g7966 [Chara braunii]